MNQYEYDGHVVALIDPCTVDVRLHLSADVGFDTKMYFGTMQKRMHLLNCDVPLTKYMSLQADIDNYMRRVADRLLNRNFLVKTHKGLHHATYACELFNIHGDSINEQMIVQGLYER